MSESAIIYKEVEAAKGKFHARAADSAAEAQLLINAIRVHGDTALFNLAYDFVGVVLARLYAASDLDADAVVEDAKRMLRAEGFTVVDAPRPPVQES